MKRTNDAFTLVELLVVIGILAVLAAIVLPVMSGAREAGRKASCQSNLRQIYLGVQQYVQDNDGWYPAYNGNGNARAWQYKVSPYIKDIRVFRCPTLNNPITDDALPIDQIDYAYNGSRFTRGILVSPAQGEHEAALPAGLSTLFLNWCTNQAKLLLKDPDLDDRVSGSCGRPLFFKGVRHHSKGTNWSFADGHVKWLTPERLAEVDCQNPPPPTRTRKRAAVQQIL